MEELRKKTSEKRQKYKDGLAAFDEASIENLSRLKHDYIELVLKEDLGWPLELYAILTSENAKADPLLTAVEIEALNEAPEKRAALEWEGFLELLKLDLVELIATHKNAGKYFSFTYGVRDQCKICNRRLEHAIARILSVNKRGDLLVISVEVLVCYACSRFRVHGFKIEPEA